MKRAIALLLVCTLCLGMTACSFGKYSELTKLLDNGDYDTAIAYIEGLKAADSGELLLDTGEADSSGDGVPDTALLQSFIGDWENAYEDSEGPKKLSIKEDGTCTLDGISTTWSLDESMYTISDSDDVYLKIAKDESSGYRLKMKTNGKGETALSGGTYETNSSGMMTYTVAGITYINPANYEIVEVTTENWQEYFELTEETAHETNAFGEIDSFHTTYRFSLKQKYYDMLGEYIKGSGAVETKYTPAIYTFKIDIENKTYTKDTLQHKNPATKDVDTLSSQETFFGANYAGYSVFGVDSMTPTTTTTYPEDVQVIRVACTLYLQKTN